MLGSIGRGLELGEFHRVVVMLTTVTPMVMALQARSTQLGDLHFVSHSIR